MTAVTHPYTVHGYTLLQPIGEGSFGVVWKALAPGDFPAAVKFISRARDDMIALPELKALQEVRDLNHPYLVKSLACWEEKDWLIIVMEYADGNLRERFDHCVRQGQVGVPADELLHYLREAASALDYLHGLKKLHRDIKPENLLLFNGMPAHAKIGDCGLLKDQDRVATMRPQGSPPFMAPEAWDCRPCPASDQFALAVTYAEMRQGRRPFSGRRISEIEEAIRMHAPDLAGLPEDEAAALARALAKSPADRYESCFDLVVALEAAMGLRADGYRPRTRVEMLKEVPSKLAVPSRPAETTKQGAQQGTRIENVAPAPQPQPQPRPVVPKPAPPRPWPRWPAAAALVALVAVGGAWLATRGLNGPDKPGTRDPDPEPRRVPVVEAKPTQLGMPREDVPPVVVPPETVKVTVPAGYAAASDATLHTTPGGKTYHSRIVRSFGGEAVTLRLITGANPFYVMENKVWNGLYQQFARGGRGGEAWQRGGKKDGADVGIAVARHPAFRTTRKEAEGCAAWLGGKLPTADQLDAAARFENRVWGKDVAVGLRLEGPRPVGTAAGDRSFFGVYDLAGNGMEWTRDTLEGGKVAVLRGRSYSASGSLTAADLKGDLQLGQYPDVGSPYTGFRAVIELSAP